MHIVHRFYDLLIGGAEVVILNMVTALHDHEHTLVFSRARPNWIEQELRSKSNVQLVLAEQGREAAIVNDISADVYCFHYYPPMSETDFRDLSSSVFSRSILVNHWYREVPHVPELRYLFLSEQSRRTTGTAISSRDCRTLLNPVADRFFNIRRMPIPLSVGRHSRDADFKFSHQFFDIHEAILPGDLKVYVLGAPSNMQRFVSSELVRLRNSYYLLDFGSLRVDAFLETPEIYLYQTRDDFAETCPMNILEALASGIPIVAEAKGGIVDLIKPGENGFLCSGPQDYVDAAQNLFSNENLRRQFSQNARQWAFENVSLVNYRGKFLETVASLLSRGG